MGLKYEDISPKVLIPDQTTAMLADIAMLEALKSQFVEVPCPACEVPSYAVLYEKYGMRHVACRSCETQYISPRPTPAILSDFYRTSKNYEFWAKHIFPATAEARRERIFKPRAECVARLCREQGFGRGTLVEVGAGYGFFCEEIAKLGVFNRVVGIEPTPHLAAICRDKGIEVIESVVEDVHFEQKVDVIVNFEVIEHLFNPRAFLRSCHDLLQPGGYLVLTCPNIAGFETQMLGRHSDTIDHEHLNYFSPSSLSALVGRCDFEVIESCTPGALDVDIVYERMIDRSKEAMSLNPFIQKILDAGENSRNSFQRFLTESGLSSNMMLVARRRD